MAEQKAPEKNARYSVVFQTNNNNDLRVTCKNDAFMKEIKHWYTSLTGANIKPIPKQKYTQAVILDSARKEKNFGEFDWESIVIDHMMTLGFQLVSDGRSTQMISTQYSKQEVKIFFLSPAPSVAEGSGPPKYTMQ